MIDGMTMTNGVKIIFNSDQVEGLKKINKWLTDDDDLIFVLAGYAGTGKSTLIKKILDEYNLGVVVTAPTHKAKKVIMSLTNRPGFTLQSLLGLRPDVELDDFNPNNPKFNQIATPKIIDFNLVIVDEASMINEDLFWLMMSECHKGRGTKILFVGDPAQIPPVGEKASMVFNAAKDGTIQHFHLLKKIERQASSNPLSSVYSVLRKNLNVSDGGYLHKTILNDHNGVCFTTDKRWFYTNIISDFSNNRDIKVLAWKNETIKLVNQIIRIGIFGHNTDNVEVGDQLMAYRNVTSENHRRNILENSGDYNVIEKCGLERNLDDIDGYRVVMKEDNHQKIHAFVINTNDANNLNKYAITHDMLRDKALKSKSWKRYYEFRRNNILMQDIEYHTDGSARVKNDIIRKDIYYGFAITVHKSQGSTYEAVYILEEDINANWSTKERNQIKYVAFTRPSKTATVLTTRIDE